MTKGALSLRSVAPGKKSVNATGNIKKILES